MGIEPSGRSPQFLYGRVLEQPLGDIGTAVRAKRPRSPIMAAITAATAFQSRRQVRGASVAGP
jgi:hypothetical protein